MTAIVNTLKNDWIKIIGFVFFIAAAWATMGQKIDLNAYDVRSLKQSLEDGKKESEARALQVNTFIAQQTEINSNVKEKLSRIEGKLDQVLERK